MYKKNIYMYIDGNYNIYLYEHWQVCEQIQKEENEHVHIVSIL